MSIADFNMNNFNSLPLPGLSAGETSDYQSFLRNNSTTSGRMLQANESLSQIYSDDPIAKMAMAKVAPQLAQQLNSPNPAKESLSMLATLLAGTQNDLFNAMCEGDDPDWMAQMDPTTRATDNLKSLHDQYGWMADLK